MNLLKKIKREYWILTGILFLTFFARFPSLFEPFWYGDEGIFAAVARNLNLGGVLYQTAWDNKPPMIYLTYQAIFKYLGVSMFSLHLVASCVVLTTSVVIYEIALFVMGQKRAFLATAIFGILSSLRIVEGNLALTEIFMILPISLAMWLAIWRKFDFKALFVSGLLFGIASLFKQVGALEAGALGLFLFLYTKSFFDFMKKGIFLTLGFFCPYAITFLYFAPKNLTADWIFAAYTYYRIYLGESPKYAVLVNILKFMPIVAVIFYGLLKKLGKLKSAETLGADVFHLFLLWMAFSFLGSYFSGRTYGHYMVQALPALALVLSSVNFKPQIKRVQVIFALFFFVPLIFLTKLLFSDFFSGGPVVQINYYKNFIEFAAGKKTLAQYNNYFDNNVNKIMALSDFLAAEGLNGTSVYIWGDIPWLYAISDLKNPSRYVTSFHVFGVPNGKEEVLGDLGKNMPGVIILPKSSIGYFDGLENLLSKKYTLQLQIDDSRIFAKSK